MKNWFKWFVPSLLIGGVVTAGTIKTWSNGEVLTASQLNANFQHIHNLMVGGHGARLVDADVSASAAISTSKLAAYRLMPRTWVGVTYANGACGTAAGACTETSPAGTTVVGVSAGLYTVTLGYTAQDTSYWPVITPISNGGAVSHVCTVGDTPTTTTFLVYCENDANPPVATDVGFTAVVYDDN